VVVLIGVKRWWQHVACWFGSGCSWHYKPVRRGESKERLCTVPGCHRRQMFKADREPEFPGGGYWVTIKRDRRRKRVK